MRTIDEINFYYSEKLKVLESERASEYLFDESTLKTEREMTKAVIDLTVEAIALKMTIEQIKGILN